ncbi:MAG: nucleotidyl transferase AbiEii/AbiGii toxin family protein [Thermoleophilia bacterium]
MLELLSEIGRHPFLKDRLILHGGTALNVFHLSLPRLSIDIDVLYVGQVPREGMLSEREEVKANLLTLFRQLDYLVSEPTDEHAGLTYRLQYAGEHGRDFLKVDLGFLNRSPLLPSERLPCPFCQPPVSFGVLAYLELIAGKLKALVERRHAALRDLYDLYRVAGLGRHDVARLRPIAVYYWSLASTFPSPFEGGVVDRFTGMEAELESDLYPVLSSYDRPSLATMQEAVATFVDEVRPDAKGEEYLRLMELGEYHPELLFGQQPDMLEPARQSPAARWKVQNLRKRIGIYAD